MKPYLTVDHQTTLHLARPNWPRPCFGPWKRTRGHLRPWLPWVDGTRSLADTKTFIQESMAHNSDGSRLTTFILYGEQLAGSLGVVSFNKDHRKCELGYWLREDLQGLGIMSSSLAVFIGFLFKNKGINRIEVQVALGNDRSRKVAERLGFHCEGILRQSIFMYGSFHDVELFSLLKADWGLRKYV